MQTVGVLSPERCYGLLAFLYGDEQTSQTYEEVAKLTPDEFDRVYQVKDDIRDRFLSILEAVRLPQKQQAELLGSLRRHEIDVTPEVMEQIKKLRPEECDRVSDVIFVVCDEVASILEAAEVSPERADLLKKLRYGDKPVPVTRAVFEDVQRLTPDECRRVDDMIFVVREKIASILGAASLLSTQAKLLKKFRCGDNPIPITRAMFAEVASLTPEQAHSIYHTTDTITCSIRDGFVSISEVAILSLEQAELLSSFRHNEIDVTREMFERIKRLTYGECERVSTAQCVVRCDVASIFAAAKLLPAQATLLWELEHFGIHATKEIFEVVGKLTDEKCTSVSCAKDHIKSELLSISEAKSLSLEQAKLLACFTVSYIPVTRKTFEEVGKFDDSKCCRVRDVRSFICREVATIQQAASLSRKQADLLVMFSYNGISVTQDIFLKAARLTDEQCDRAHHARRAIRDKGADILEAAGLSSAQAELLWSVRYNKAPVTPAMFAMVKSLPEHRCRQIIEGSDKDKADVVEFDLRHQFSLFRKGSCLFAQVGRQAMMDVVRMRHACPEAQRAYDERYGLVLAQCPGR